MKLDLIDYCVCVVYGSIAILTLAVAFMVVMSAIKGAP